MGWPRQCLQGEVDGLDLLRRTAPRPSASSPAGTIRMSLPVPSAARTQASTQAGLLGVLDDHGLQLVALHGEVAGVRTEPRHAVVPRVVVDEQGLDHVHLQRFDDPAVGLGRPVVLAPFLPPLPRPRPRHSPANCRGHGVGSGPGTTPRERCAR